MKKALIPLLLASSAFSAVAGTSSGKVTTMIINSSNYLFFTAGTKSGTPNCGTSNANQWALNLNTAQGKSIYALLLSAQAQEKVVTIIGGSTCNNWGDREDVAYGYIE